MLKCVHLLLLLSATVQATTDYVDPSKLKSKEPICTQSTVDEYEGDGGFQKSEAAGSEIKKRAYNPDKLTKSDRPNIFEDLMGGKTPDNTKMMAYMQAIVAIGIPCVLVIVFNLCNCICCICCRNCFHCLFLRCERRNPCRVCQCIPATRHYTREEQYMPVVVFLCIGLTLFGFAIAGVANGVHKFNDSLIEGICLTDNTYIRFSQFLTNVKNPLDTLEIDFNSAVVLLNDVAVIDQSLSQNVADIAPKFNDLQTTAQHSKDTVPTNNANAKRACENFWQSIVEIAAQAEIDTVASATSLDMELQKIQKTIDSSLLQSSTTASDALVTAKNTVDSMQTQLDTSMDPRSYNLLVLAGDIKGQKDNSGFAAFGWVFLSLLLVTTSLVGVHHCHHHTTLKKPPIDNPHLPLNVIELNTAGKCFARFAAIGWCCALFFGIFCGVFAMFMLPLSAVMTDVCVVLPTLPNQLDELSGNAEIGKVVDTCWNATGNLLDGLGLSDSIDVDAINFDEFDKRFGGDDVVIDTSGLDDILNKLDEVVTGKLAQVDENKCGSVNPVKTATENVKTQCAKASQAFEDSPLVEKLKQQGRNVIGLVKTAIVGFVEATNCYFIKVIWDEVTDVMCVSLKDSIQWWGTAELFIGLFCLPYAITVLFMMKRYGGHGPIAAKGAAHVAKDSDGAQVEMTGQEPLQQQTYVDVLVPPGHGAGAFLTTTDPNTGLEMTVTVPEGVMEQQTFRVQLELTEVVAEYAGDGTGYDGVLDDGSAAAAAADTYKEVENTTEYVDADAAVADENTTEYVDEVGGEGSQEQMDALDDLAVGADIQSTIVENDDGSSTI